MSPQGQKSSRDSSDKAPEHEEDSHALLTEPTHGWLLSPSKQANTQVQTTNDPEEIRRVHKNIVSECKIENRQLGIDFESIRKICDNDSGYGGTGTDPYMLAPHRQSQWPRPAAFPEDLADIYNKVRRSGLPNSLGEKITLPSKLNLDRWDELLGSDNKYDKLRSFVRHGFPMGYMGPVSNYNEKYNHSSAVAYKKQIDKFLEKEISLGGMVGPMDTNPFEVTHVPLNVSPKEGF